MATNVLVVGPDNRAVSEPTVEVSAGAADAGKQPRLNSSGLLDSSLIQFNYGIHLAMVGLVTA